MMQPAHKPANRHDSMHTVTTNFDFMKPMKEENPNFGGGSEPNKYILLSDADKIA
jgi:hypothetical protein